MSSNIRVWTGYFFSQGKVRGKQLINEEPCYEAGRIQGISNLNTAVILQYERYESFAAVISELLI